MLRTLDILIGFVGIMLLLSMAATFITQAVVTGLNLRGRHLQKGIVLLLSEVFPEAGHDIVDAIATAVLTHPLIATVRGGLGTVIERDELTRVLLELASNAGRSGAYLSGSTAASLRMLLKDHGVTEPEMALRQIEAFAMELETTERNASEQARHTTAVVRGANSPFVASLHAWFDATMARTSEQFVFRTRVVTFGVAALIVALLQIDSVGLLNRLAINDQLRAMLVEQGPDLIQRYEASPHDDNRADRIRSLHEEALSGLIVVPTRSWLFEWRQRWSAARIPGLALSAILLTLGAPLWFRLLKDAIRLRPLLARKDDLERRAVSDAGRTRLEG